MTASLLGGGAFALNASAATSSTDRADSLASKIASKFNLNKDDVKKVLDEDRAANQAERQKEMLTRAEERLTQAVKDGKLTEAQKTKILDKIKSEQSFMDSLKDKTQAERKTAMDQHRTELQQWAKDNGIDEKYVMMGGPGGRGGHGPHGDGDFDGQKNSNSQSTSSSTTTNTN